VQFEENYHVITMAMPDYDGNQLRRFWGYSFTDMVDGLAFVIEPYLKKKSQVILVGHDWGAAIGFLYLSAYPGTVDKFVTLDIGRKENVDWVQIFYMTYLAIVFLLSRVIPDRLASLFMALYPWKAIGPCPYETEVPMTPRTMKAFMCYPYLKVIFEVVRSFFGEQFKVIYVSFAKHNFLTHLDTKYFNNYCLCILLFFAVFADAKTSCPPIAYIIFIWQKKTSHVSFAFVFG